MTEGRKLVIVMCLLWPSFTSLFSAPMTQVFILVGLGSLGVTLALFDYFVVIIILYPSNTM